PVSENYADYAFAVKKSLEEAGIRVEIDIRNEKLGYKIREAEMMKVPYMLVLGENEKNSGGVSVRKREAGDLGAKSIPEI
ncbi:His/Gly/Thr/Pro-type tRNA ligase C-terminal domain-containing protein, partial [Shewanella sp. A3A]|nr:His/Gly/Thr/Pro-type tRNA ligase C-terminal domain-containing protein [Shewanella ferrihydritica]